MPVGDLVIPSLRSVAARSELRRLTRRVAGLSGLSIAGQVTRGFATFALRRPFV